MTNILRDIDEDAELGRLYLPAEALAQAGIPAGEPREVIAHPAIGQVCAGLAREAQAHYDRSHAIMARCPARQVRSPRIMAAVYHEIRAHAGAWLECAACARKVPRVRLLWLVLRHALG